MVDRPHEYEQAHGKYVIDQSVMDCLRDDAIIMHPLPRVDEVDPAIDGDPRAAYFRQAHNGLYVRMVFVAHVVGAV